MAKITFVSLLLQKLQAGMEAKMLDLQAMLQDVLKVQETVEIVIRKQYRFRPILVAAQQALLEQPPNVIQAKKAIETAMRLERKTSLQYFDQIGRDVTEACLAADHTG